MAYALMIPAMLSALVLAAHFLRGLFTPFGLNPVSAILILLSLALIPLVLVPRRWAIRVVQIVLMLGAVEWLLTLVGIVRDREAQGRSWMAAAIILGSVMIFTALSALLLEAAAVRWRYLGHRGQGFQVVPETELPPKEGQSNTPS